MWHVWGRVKMQRFGGWGNLVKKNHLEYLGKDVRIILKLIIKKYVDWINLAREWDERQSGSVKCG
jgi:hypothetical protein